MAPTDNQPDFMRAELKALRELTFLRAVDFHEQIGSTNDRALEWAADSGRPLPALILARRQSAGRGRGTNTWWSDNGALTFSLVLEPHNWGTTVADWPKVSLTVGLAVCLALEPMTPTSRPRLKWPNDVYVGDRKICGVLIEVPQRTAGRVVIGIGINVNNSFDTAPDEQHHTAISLRQVTGRSHRLAHVLQQILACLDQQLYLLAERPRELLNRWGAYCMLQGRRISWDQGAEKKLGQCLGINEHGALLMRTDAGVEAIHGGVVRLVD